MTAAWLGYFEGLIALALIVGGPLGAHLRWAPALFGMQLFIFGLLFGLIALLLGALAFFQSRKPAVAAARPRAMFALGIGLGTVALIVAIAAVLNATAYPSINDLTTDPAHPLEFSRAGALPVNHGRDLTYNAAVMAPRQQRLYAKLAPLRVAMAPDALFTRVRTVAAAMPGWTVTAVDPATRTLEAVAESPIFRFRDDIVIAVRDDHGAGVVEMRSKARDVVGDLGANYSNIRNFFARLSATTGRPA